MTDRLATAEKALSDLYSALATGHIRRDLDRPDTLRGKNALRQAYAYLTGHVEGWIEESAQEEGT